MGTGVVLDRTVTHSSDLHRSWSTPNIFCFKWWTWLWIGIFLYFWSIENTFPPLADFKGALIQYSHSGNRAWERQSRFLSTFRQQSQNDLHAAGVPVCHTWYTLQKTHTQTEVHPLISMLEIDYFFQSSKTLHQKWRLMIGPGKEWTSHLMKDTSSISMCSRWDSNDNTTVLQFYNLCDSRCLGIPILFLHYSYNKQHSTPAESWVCLKKKGFYSQLRQGPSSKYHLQGKKQQENKLLLK